VTDRFERLSTGFLFTEGPRWHPTGKFLLLGSGVHGQLRLGRRRLPIPVRHRLDVALPGADRGSGAAGCSRGQNVEFSLALADRVYVLEKGSIRFRGSAAELRDNEALRHELLAL
jgi:hypothetical protein